MNLTVTQPVSYPFYMESSHHPYGNVAWQNNPFVYPTHGQQIYQAQYPTVAPVAYQAPFVLRQQTARAHISGKSLNSISSYSNTRYNHLKQSTSHANRHRSVDAAMIYGQPMASTPILSSHNQHHRHHHHHHHPHPPQQHQRHPQHHQEHQQTNPYIQTTKEMSGSDFHRSANFHSAQLSRAHSWHSMATYNNDQINFNQPNEMNQVYQHYFPNDSHRSNTNIPRRQFFSPPLSAGLMRASTFDQMPMITNPIYQRSRSSSSHTSSESLQKTDTRKSLSSVSSSSSSSSSDSASRQSLQKRLNGTLLADPLLVAAMKDYQKRRRSTSRSTVVTTQHRDLSRDSLCSESSEKSLSESSNHHHRSQSSFTSLERLEIRHLIKALKTHGIRSLDEQLQTSLKKPSTETMTKTHLKTTILPANVKQHRSTVTEELEEKFAQLRSAHPDQEFTYVKPSQLKQSKSIKMSPKRVEIPLDREKENTVEEIKAEYAVPAKSSTFVNLRTNKSNEGELRSFSFCKPIHDLINESRPKSMFNCVQYGLTNPLPTVYSSNPTTSDDDDVCKKSSVKENIYASEIDVHVPHSDEKDILYHPDYLNDYLSNYKATTKHSSILQDFSKFFSRLSHHENDEKLKRKCKYHQKSNYLRCSIM